jgi:predicted metal-dependent hydrolase
VDRDYFECHEILEEFWKEETDQSKNSIWVGFILLAVANYHHRRNNFSGATKTLEKAIAIFHCEKGTIVTLGLNVDEFFDILHGHMVGLKNKNHYKSYSLPIILSNRQLLQCFTQSEISKMKWDQTSDLNNQSLVHRHMLRDRTDVIIEREDAQRKKQKD